MAKKYSEAILRQTRPRGGGTMSPLMNRRQQQQPTYSRMDNELPLQVALRRGQLAERHRVDTGATDREGARRSRAF